MTVFIRNSNVYSNEAFWKDTYDPIQLIVPDQQLGLGMPSKKKTPYGGTLSQLEGGRGWKTSKCPYLKYLFTRELFSGGEGVKSLFHLSFLHNCFFPVKIGLNAWKFVEYCPPVNPTHQWPIFTFFVTCKPFLLALKEKEKMMENSFFQNQNSYNLECLRKFNKFP